MEKPKLQLVGPPQQAQRSEGLQQPADSDTTGAFDPFALDETQPMGKGRSILEPDEVLRYVQQRGYRSWEDPSSPKPKNKLMAGALSGAKSSLLSRPKNAGLREDTDLYQTLKEAVAEGDTSMALKLAKRGSRRLAGGDIMMANTLSRLPYSRRVERYLHKLERKTRSDEGVAPGYLAELTRAYADNNSTQQNTAPRAVFSEESAEPMRVSVGAGNTDSTEIRDDTRPGNVIHFPQPDEREEMRPAHGPYKRKVLVAAASVAALLGSMNMLRGFGGNETPQSAALPPLPSAESSTTTTAAIPEAEPVVVEIPSVPEVTGAPLLVSNVEEEVVDNAEDAQAPDEEAGETPPPTTSPETTLPPTPPTTAEDLEQSPPTTASPTTTTTTTAPSPTTTTTVPPTTTSSTTMPPTSVPPTTSQPPTTTPSSTTTTTTTTTTTAPPAEVLGGGQQPTEEIQLAALGSESGLD